MKGVGTMGIRLSLRNGGYSYFIFLLQSDQHNMKMFVTEDSIYG